MFINKTRFRQAIKEAYNNNDLQVGVPETWGGVYIKGIGWEIWMDQLPNWAKGALIKYIGDFPEAGEIHRYGKKMEGLWETAAWLGDEFLQLLRNESKESCMITPLVYNREGITVRFAQNKTTKKILMIVGRRCELLDLDQMEEGEEVDGPREAAGTGMIYWENDHCVLGICVQNTAQAGEKLRPLMQQLEKIDFQRI